ncbi:MAG: 30S ribosomal protein S4 [Eubacteriales bacterium]|nr:30S ribosomal protein S4 [Eubacteriales bacterium]
MARYTGSVCRQCRREGMKLFLKGDRCHSGKCAMERYPAAPGMHGTGRRKPSGYQVQLREKQKVKRIYGVLETQFRIYFEKAANMKGATGENMLQLLERRLDNVVYRLGFADSRAQARQLVNHGHFAVNGKKVDIPSYCVDAGDVITVRENSTDIEMFKKLREGTTRLIPAWLELDAANLSGKVVELPKRSDIDMSIDELLIVELYSK